MLQWHAPRKRSAPPFSAGWSTCIGREPVHGTWETPDDICVVVYLQVGEVPELFSSREGLTKKLLPYWESYTHPKGHLGGVRGYERLITAFEALMEASLNGLPEDHPGHVTAALLVECWYAAVMATAHKIPGANPPLSVCLPCDSGSGPQ